MEQAIGQSVLYVTGSSVMRVQWFFVVEGRSAVVARGMALLVGRRLRPGGSKSTIVSRIACIAMGGVMLLACAILALVPFVVQPIFAPGVQQNGHSLAAFRFQAVSDISWHSPGRNTAAASFC
jgi:hypothetical protein